MVTLPEETLSKWQSKSFKRKAKTEMTEKFCAKFGLSEEMFYKYIRAYRDPTPDQYDWIVSEVNRYYAHYNPPVVGQEQTETTVSQ